MRTTIDLDPVVLAELKRRQVLEHKTLGALVSELLAAALAESAPRNPVPLSWPTAELGARIDIDDKNALWAALDQA